MRRSGFNISHSLKLHKRKFIVFFTKDSPVYYSLSKYEARSRVVLVFSRNKVFVKKGSKTLYLVFFFGVNSYWKNKD